MQHKTLPSKVYTVWCLDCYGAGCEKCKGTGKLRVEVFDKQIGITPKRFARVLYSDPSGRWFRGEIGQMEEHNFDKYDYCLNFGQDKRTGMFARRYYFFKGEIEELTNV